MLTRSYEENHKELKVIFQKSKGQKKIFSYINYC